MLEEFIVKYALNNATDKTKDWADSTTEIIYAHDMQAAIASAETYVDGYNQSARDLGIYASLIKISSITDAEVEETENAFEEENAKEED